MRAKKWTGWMVVAAMAALAIAVVVTRAGAREEVREIRLVARGMTFYLDGDSTINPTITLAHGERVRFVLRNETQGINHDLVIAPLGVAIAPLPAGETGVFDLDVPDRLGRYEYHCRPHAVMMKGTIVVAAGP